MMDNGMRNIAWGLAFMLAGSVAVIGTLLMINRLAEGPDAVETESRTEFQVDKRPEPEPQRIVKREPPQRPKPQDRQAPMVELDSSLSGIDFGIPGLDTGDLDGLRDQLLGDTDNVVMTDESVDAPPRPTYQAPVNYPPRARSQGVQGYVVLSVLISAAGEIEKVQVLESEPSGVFEDSAVRGVRNWRFEPAQYQGRNVKVWARQRIRFDLT